MREDTTISFMNPAFRDELSELVREGAQRIIRQAVEAELGAFWRNMRPIVTRVWSACDCPQRLPACAGGVDGGRPGGGSGPLDAGQERGGPLFPLGVAAALLEEDPAGGSGGSVAVFEGDIDERFR